MGLNTQVIGTSLTHGYAGSYASQPDMIIDTKPAAETITFGQPLIYDGNGKVKVMGAEATATQFVGIAGREIKSSYNYLDQSVGQYSKGDATSVFKRGCINVICQRGKAKTGGKVYVRITANHLYESAVVGGFEAEADGGNSVELTNCQWAGSADTNNVAELRIMTMINA